MMTLLVADQAFLGFTGAAAAIVLVLVAITAVLWFFLPFAVFGIKNRLDKMIVLAQALADGSDRTNALLEGIRDQQAAQLVRTEAEV